MSINPPKTVTSSEQRQAILLDCEPLEDVDVQAPRAPKTLKAELFLLALHFLTWRRSEVH